MNELQDMLNEVYEKMEGSDTALNYSERHGIKSAAVLTVFDDETADLIASRLEPRIGGKTVIEIGGGIGLLAFHLGRFAKHVYCIEANPAWAQTFAAILYIQKPTNVSYLFGVAEEFEGIIRGDVALFCSHSGIPTLRALGARFAPTVIDIYGELIDGNPEAFDPIARRLRYFELDA